jgi:hypothetical protein
MLVSIELVQSEVRYVEKHTDRTLSDAVFDAPCALIEAINAVHYP